MEKLILPFDHETWYGICITFIVSSIVIIICNQFPNKLRKIFYGSAKKTKVFNIFQTFFGISHIKVPKNNFTRIILISFIFWCLVIRTAYQGKLFEFTTTAIRKPKLKTLEDLRSKNFSIFFASVTSQNELFETTQKSIGYVVIQLSWRFEPYYLY